MGHLHSRNAFSAFFVLSLALAGGCGDSSSDSDSSENGGAGIGGAAMGMGGAAMGVGGAAMGAGGTAVGAGGAPMGVGGAVPGVGGTVPGVGGTIPGVGGTPLGVGGVVAAVGGATPGAGGTTPAAGGTTPAAGGTILSAGGTVPGAGGADPGVGGVGVAGEPAVGGTGSGGEPATGGTAGVAGMGGTAGSAGEESGGTGGVEECVVPTGSPGTPIVFNDDGGWCWYQDERAIVDPDTNTLIFGSVAIGGSRNGNVDVTMYDLDAGGSPQRSTLGDLNPDDHNTAGLIKLGTGRYVAMYTTHNDDCYSYYNIYNNGNWGSQNRFDWGPHGCPTPTNRTVSYSNLWQVDGEFYNFVRSVDTSPNLMVSSNGDSWSYGGRLTAQPLVGYVAGYYKYWGNNVDRVDFLATEAHPRDNDNSLYHGYVQNGRSYRSDGTQVDSSLADTSSVPDIVDFTTVFGTGSQLGPVSLRHLWNCDLMRYDDGTIVAIFTGRADYNSDDPDKRFGYARWDGSSWHSTYLTHAGHKLYDSEQDYTGLGAVHPNNPYTIYISTTTDPRNDTSAFQYHEIWRGTTCDEGATFEWTPITENSSADNLRPIVPYWESNRTVLLWMRGTYHSAQTYDTEIVGLVLDGP